MAPVELVGFVGRKAQRHKGVRRRPCLLVAPRFGETMHAVMRAIVTAASQLFEQALRVDRRSRRGSLASFSRIWASRASTHAPSFGAGCNAAPTFLNAVLWLRTTLRTVARRDAERPHDLLNRQALLEISAPDIADHVHGHHPPNPSQADLGHRERR